MQTLHIFESEVENTFSPPNVLFMKDVISEEVQFKYLVSKNEW